MARWLRLLIIYAMVAVAVYVAIYFLVIAPPVMMPGAPCMPSIYKPCP